MSKKDAQIDAFQQADADFEFEMLMYAMRGVPEAQINFWRRLRDCMLHPHPLPAHVAGTAADTIIRVHLKDNPKDAFNELGHFPDKLEDMAHALRVRTMWECPAIWKDGEALAKRWTLDYYCGFKNVEQASKWFAHPDIRAKVYDHPRIVVMYYEVWQDQTLYGDHQVGFLLSEARNPHLVPRELWVHGHV